MKISHLLRRASAFSLLFVFLYFLVPAVARAASPSAPQAPTPGQGLLETLVQAGTLDDLHWPNFADYRDDVKKFYEASNYALAWVKDGRPTPQALSVIAALEQADQEGLNPEDYDGPLWKDRIAKLTGQNPTEDQLARFDLAVTVSLARYVSEGVCPAKAGMFSGS